MILLMNFLKHFYKKIEEEMKGSEFVFESVDLLYYSINKTILRRGRSYVKPPKWLENKRALTVALNHQNIERDHQGISKNKPFINQYNWNDIDFPSH